MSDFNDMDWDRMRGVVRDALFPRYFGVGHELFVERQDGAVFRFIPEKIGSGRGFSFTEAAWRRVHFPPVPTPEQEPLTKEKRR